MSASAGVVGIGETPKVDLFSSFWIDSEMASCFGCCFVLPLLCFLVLCFLFLAVDLERVDIEELAEMDEFDVLDDLDDLDDLEDLVETDLGIGGGECKLLEELSSLLPSSSPSLAFSVT